MIANGTINEKGEVLMGNERQETKQADQSDASTAPRARE